MVSRKRIEETDETVVVDINIFDIKDQLCISLISFTSKKIREDDSNFKLNNSKSLVLADKDIIHNHSSAIYNPEKKFEK